MVPQSAAHGGKHTELLSALFSSFASTTRVSKQIELLWWGTVHSCIRLVSLAVPRAKELLVLNRDDEWMAPLPKDPCYRVTDAGSGLAADAPAPQATQCVAFKPLQPTHVFRNPNR